MASQSIPPNQLHNPWEGQADAWQLHETVDDFLTRLPPVTTTLTTAPWIWVANPFREGRGKPGRNLVEQLTEQGHQLMAESQEIRRRIQSQDAAKAQKSTTRLINEESERLKQKLADLAKETNVLSGKVGEPCDLSPMLLGCMLNICFSGCCFRIR